jgi:hypothetical protein
MTKKDVLTDHRIFLHSANTHKVTGMGLLNSWTTSIDTACVIQGLEFERARDSVLSHGMSVHEISQFGIYKKLPIKDPRMHVGADFFEMIAPRAYRDQDWVKQLRLTSHIMTLAQVSRCLNHVAAWNYSVTEGKPVIVMESTAILKQAHTEHVPRNSIIGLAGSHGLIKHNLGWHCMPGVFAYSIDQFVAKRLLSQIMTHGIRDPLELMFRADQYMIMLEHKAVRKISLINTENQGAN